MSDESAKRAILDRRARFVAAAIASVGLVAGAQACKGSPPPEPCLSVAPDPEPEPEPEPCLSVAPEPEPASDAGPPMPCLSPEPPPDPEPEPEVCLSVPAPEGAGDPPFAEPPPRKG